MEDPADETAIRARMQQARRTAGLSQDELATKISVKTRTLQKWYSGDLGVPYTRLHDYAAATGVTHAWLINGGTTATPSQLDRLGDRLTQVEEKQVEILELLREHLARNQAGDD